MPLVWVLDWGGHCAAHAGFSDFLIQMIGWWKSSAFLEHIRIDMDIHIAAKLAWLK